MVGNIIKIGLGIIAALWSLQWNAMKAEFGLIWNGIKAVASKMWSDIEGIYRTATAMVKSIWSSFWNGLGGIVSNAIASVRGPAETIAGLVKKVVDAVNGLITAVGKARDFLAKANPASHVPGILKPLVGGAISNLNNAIKKIAVGAPYGMPSNVWKLVGENGPELLGPSYGKGMGVYNQRQMGSLLGLGANVASGAIQLNFYGPTQSEDVRQVVHEEFKNLVTALQRNQTRAIG
jgi:hypothetical protein